MWVVLKATERREACVGPSPGPLQIPGGDIVGSEHRSLNKEEEEREGVSWVARKMCVAQDQGALSRVSFC